MVVPSDIVFGRLPSPDPRDSSYPMRAMLSTAVTETAPVFRYWAHFFPPLNQGGTGTCVAHATKHWMQAAPVIQTAPTKPPSPFDMYREFVLKDEWFDNDREATLPDRELQFGTSVRAAFQWLKDHGYIPEYRWAQSPQDMMLWLLTMSPIVFGINWYEGMMRPDADGYIHPTGRLLGGHAILGIGAHRLRDDYTLFNSWGLSYGNNGRVRIHAADLNRLVFEQAGEAAAGVEQRLVRI